MGSSSILAVAFAICCLSAPRSHAFSPSPSRHNVGCHRNGIHSQTTGVACAYKPFHRRPGRTSFSSSCTPALSAARKAAAKSSSALQTVWNQWLFRPRVKWILALWKTIRVEIANLSSNQKWIMVAILFVGIQLGRSLNSLILRRFQDAEDIPTRFFGPTAPCLTGRAVSISDGDTLRFYHRPTPFHKSTLNKNTDKLSKCTLLVRLCTIDAPETAKFGKPGQPFGEEAKKELQKLIENRIIQIRLLTIDQYGRAVAQVFVPRRIPLFRQRRGVDEILLLAGLAEVYQGLGAAFGPKGREEYLNLEERARKAKKGIWSRKQRESAAEYKRRTK